MTEVKIVDRRECVGSEGADRRYLVKNKDAEREALGRSRLTQELKRGNVPSFCRV